MLCGLMFVPPELASWTSFDNGPQRADIYNMVPYKQTQLPDKKCIVTSQHFNIMMWLQLWFNCPTNQMRISSHIMLLMCTNLQTVTRHQVNNQSCLNLMAHCYSQLLYLSYVSYTNLCVIFHSTQEKTHAG